MDKEMNWDSALERHEDRVNNEVKKQNKTDIFMCHENQEPVGVVNPMGGIDYRLGQEPLPPRTKLYTAPPQREWVEPSDAKLRDMHHIEEFGLFCDYDEFEQIARTVLKLANELNHG